MGAYRELNPELRCHRAPCEPLHHKPHRDPLPSRAFHPHELTAILKHKIISGTIYLRHICLIIKVGIRQLFHQYIRPRPHLATLDGVVAGDMNRESRTIFRINAQKKIDAKMLINRRSYRGKGLDPIEVRLRDELPSISERNAEVAQ